MFEPVPTGENTNTLLQYEDLIKRGERLTLNLLTHSIGFNGKEISLEPISFNHKGIDIEINTWPIAASLLARSQHFVSGSTLRREAINVGANKKDPSLYNIDRIIEYLNAIGIQLGIQPLATTLRLKKQIDEVVHVKVMHRINVPVEEANNQPLVRDFHTTFGYSPEFAPKLKEYIRMMHLGQIPPIFTLKEIINVLDTAVNSHTKTSVEIGNRFHFFTAPDGYDILINDMCRLYNYPTTPEDKEEITRPYDIGPTTLAALRIFALEKLAIILNSPQSKTLIANHPRQDVQQTLTMLNDLNGDEDGINGMLVPFLQTPSIGIM